MTVSVLCGLRCSASTSRRNEQGLADEYFRQLFQADEARVSDLNVQILSARASPMYIPAFVFSRYHTRGFSWAGVLGQVGSQRVKIHTFVSGTAAGVVAGTRVSGAAHRMRG